MLTENKSVNINSDFLKSGIQSNLVKLFKMIQVEKKCTIEAAREDIHDFLISTAQSMFPKVENDLDLDGEDGIEEI